MKKFIISKTRRLRSTPFTSRLEDYGVGGYTIYNHMLLPTFFKSIEDEYNHLKKDDYNNLVVLCKEHHNSVHNNITPHHNIITFYHNIPQHHNILI